MVKILKLTLNKKPFDVMKTGEKKNEFREASKWIESRLFNKDGSKRDYDFIEFSHGYQKNRNNFTCKFLGFKKMTKEEYHSYSNGLKVLVYPGHYNIFCGDIIFGPTIKVKGKRKKEKGIDLNKAEDIELTFRIGSKLYMIEPKCSKLESHICMETVLRLALDKHIAVEIIDADILDLEDKIKKIKEK